MDQRILIIDAHPVYIYKMEGFFKGLTFRNVFLTNSGSQGVAMAEIQKPDLVLLSAVLPDMTSDEVCEKIKEVSPSTKIIVQIGLFTDNEMIAQLRRAGADAVMARKEKDLAPLQKAVEGLLDFQPN